MDKANDPTAEKLRVPQTQEDQSINQSLSLSLSLPFVEAETQEKALAGR